MTYVVLDGRVVDVSSGAYYLGVPCVFSGLAIIAQWLGAGARMNLTLVLVSTTVGVYAGEIATRILWTGPDAPVEAELAACEQFFFARQSQCRFALRQGLPFATRGRLDVFGELKAASPNRSVTPGPAPALNQVLDVSGDSIAPLTGVSESLTVFCVEMEGPRAGQFRTFQSDEHGFRNPAPWDSLTGAVTLIGDSFTQGTCVDDERSIAGHLRRGQNRVLNLGVAGIGPLHELAILKEYALQSSPSLVVWLYFEGNDLIDLNDEKGRPFLLRYLSEGAYQDLYHRQALVDGVLTDWIAEQHPASDEVSEAGFVHPLGPSVPHEMLDFVLFRHVRQLVARRLIARPPPPVFPYDSVLFRRSLRAAQEALKAQDVQFLFVYLPQFERYSGGAVEPHKDAVLATARSLGIPVIDIDAVFTQTDPLEAFPNRLLGHYTPEGYRRIAGAINEWIEQH